MKFTIHTTGRFYADEKRRAALESLGFSFVQLTAKKYEIQGSPVVEIDSIEELIQFTNKWGEIIVADGAIEIYDDYRG